MPRHLLRSSSAVSHRDRVADRARRKNATSALSGHLDYVELAERVGQGVSVDEVSPLESLKPARKRRDH